MKITILGATGSIGQQTLDVIRNMPEAEVFLLAATGRDLLTLKQNILEFKPELVYLSTEEKTENLKSLLAQEPTFDNSTCEFFWGNEGLEECIQIFGEQNGNKVLVNAISGKNGLIPTMTAINAGIDIALANKESLVTAGALVMNTAREKNVRITPIDSEHSAIWQCLQGNELATIEKIILTASGGPFRAFSKAQIEKVTAKEALRHPNWDMGGKITIDSATLMNKGLELIEAMWLFDQPLENIEVLVHPQSIIHSMVQYLDSSIMAQMGLPDMRLPIMYALTAPKRKINNFPRLDLLKCGNLTFEAVDINKFPCFELACEAAKMGETTLPAVMNYVNEWAVNQFLHGQIGFYDISNLIERAFSVYMPKMITSIDDIFNAETWAEEFTLRAILAK